MAGSSALHLGYIAGAGCPAAVGRPMCRGGVHLGGGGLALAPPFGDWRGVGKAGPILNCRLMGCAGWRGERRRPGVAG